MKVVDSRHHKACFSSSCHSSLVVDSSAAEFESSTIYAIYSKAIFGILFLEFKLIGVRNGSGWVLG
jgi:hypothetical protein